MVLNTVEEIIADIKDGKMVIIMDDEDRENEGDLIMAAEHIQPQDINFMARYGRGLICLTLTEQRCRKLRLPLMVSENEERFATNFTVSIEASEGVTTGISAHDRARTVLAAVAPNAKPEDVIQPGHIFPLMARPGGVLTRAGHTETGCDLARLAGLEPASVIVEILNEDGSMARRPDLEKFAKEHDLKIGTVADLISYRLTNEHSVERLNEAVVATEFGEFNLVSYEDAMDKTVHLAMVKGDINPEDPTLVRVHLRNTLGDVLGVQSDDFSWPLRNALAAMQDEQSGVVVILRTPESAREIVDKIQDFATPETSRKLSEQEQADRDSGVLRTYGVGAQILSDLGVRKMKVLSAPKKMQAISGFGLEVVDYITPK